MRREPSPHSLLRKLDASIGKSRLGHSAWVSGGQVGICPLAVTGAGEQTTTAPAILVLPGLHFWSSPEVYQSKHIPAEPTTTLIPTRSGLSLEWHCLVGDEYWPDHKPAKLSSKPKSFLWHLFTKCVKVTACSKVWSHTEGHTEQAKHSVLCDSKTESLQMHVILLFQGILQTKETNSVMPLWTHKSEQVNRFLMLQLILFSFQNEKFEGIFMKD